MGNLVTLGVTARWLLLLRGSGGLFPPPPPRELSSSLFLCGRLVEELVEEQQLVVDGVVPVEAVVGSRALDVVVLDVVGDERLVEIAVDFEEEVVGISDKLRPISTSYTQSGDGTEDIGQGRPAVDDGDLSDEGEASRDKRDRQ